MGKYWVMEDVVGIICIRKNFNQFFEEIKPNLMSIEEYKGLEKQTLRNKNDPINSGIDGNVPFNFKDENTPTNVIKNLIKNA